jgi:maltose O-acetyltransferase
MHLLNRNKVRRLLFENPYIKLWQKMKKIIDRLILTIDNALTSIKFRAAKIRYSQFPNIHETVVLGPNVILIGPTEAFIIGQGSYINDAILTTGKNTRIVIGKRCAIGYRVSIKALTHDVNNPCPDEDGNIVDIEKDINIGDCCWIGDNVFIKEGVTIGNNVVIGANSVVTKSFEDNVIIAGVPAKVMA